MKPKIIVTTMISMILIGCEQLTQPQAFQLSTTPDGKMLRLNTKSGEIHLVTDEGLIHLNEKNPVLIVGEYYKMSDAETDQKFLKYLGSTQFETSAWAIKQLGD